MANLDVANFKENGFVLAPGFFPKEAVERVRRDARNVFINQLLKHHILETDDPGEQEFEFGLFEYFKRYLQEFINCGKQIQHLVSLHRLSLDQRIEQALIKDFGFRFPNISTRPVLYFNSRFLATEEVYWRVFPHQDWRSMQGSLDSIVVWVPLVDVDASLGPLEVVPGSHKLGLLTTEVVNSFGKVDQFTDDQFISVKVTRGDALFFSTFLVHRSGVNTTESIRWSCHFRYNNLAEKTFIERGYPHPYIYKPLDELITPNFPQTGSVAELFT